MSNTAKARLILPDDESRERFHTTAPTLGWTLFKVLDTPKDRYEEIWANADQSAALHYVEDNQYSHERFLVLRGRDVPALVPIIASAFHTITIDDLYNTIVRGGQIDETIRALTRLGVVAFDVTLEVRSAWNTGLFHPDERVQLAAIQAMSLIGSREMLPSLTELASEDPSEAVRERAQRLIDAIHERDGTP